MSRGADLLRQRLATSGLLPSAAPIARSLARGASAAAPVESTGDASPDASGGTSDDAFDGASGGTFDDASGGAPGTALPAFIAHSLARWRLLHDIPIAYLVPDTAALLPPESLRFFAIDDAWMEALTEGALMAGGRGSRELAHARDARPQAAHEARALLTEVRAVRQGRLVIGGFGKPAPVAPVAGGLVTGFLLRSELVTRWPGMELRAWTSADPLDVPPGADPAAVEAARPDLVVRILRLERLNPSLLLALFDGQPQMLWLEEPHHAVQFGVEQDGGPPELVLRDLPGATVDRVEVPMRVVSQAGPGVIDVAALALAITNATPNAVPTTAAGLARQLLRAPSRQRFGG